MTYELRRVSSPDEWRAMHDIRRATLFAPKRVGDAVRYDENHPDDRLPDNHCYQLMLDGAPIGITRLDKRGSDGGVVRLVAITPDLQRAGHGRVMEAMVCDTARRRGMTHLVVNAAKTAVEFYRRTGWQVGEWDTSELVGIAETCLQMRKQL